MSSVQATEAEKEEASLQPFLHPKSIAVIGASDVAGKVGHTVMYNLLTASFPGEVYPVALAESRYGSEGFSHLFPPSRKHPIWR